MVVYPERETATLRRDIERYGNLLRSLDDPHMRQHLEQLLKEAQKQLADLSPDRR